MSETKQHEEEDPSQPHIHDMMEKLIRQQDKIIKLLEQFAHSSGPKKVGGETSDNEDAPEDDKTSSDEDAPEDDNLTGTLCYYIILYLYFLFMIYTHLF